MDSSHPRIPILKSVCGRKGLQKRIKKNPTRDALSLQTSQSSAAGSKDPATQVGYTGYGAAARPNPYSSIFFTNPYTSISQI